MIISDPLDVRTEGSKIEVISHADRQERQPEACTCKTEIILQSNDLIYLYYLYTYTASI